MPPNKTIVVIVVFLGLILLAGITLLIFGLVMRASDPDFSFLSQDGVASPPAVINTPPGADQNIKIPSGSRVISVSPAAGGVLAVHVGDAAGGPDSILIIDPGSGRLLRRFNLTDK